MKMAVSRPMGTPDDDRARGDVDAAENHRQNAVDVVARLPLRARQKVEQTDFTHGGHAVGEQEHTDEHDGGDGGQRTHEKDRVHQIFSEVFHNFTPYMGKGTKCFAPDFPVRLSYARSLQSVMSPT